MTEEVAHVGIRRGAFRRAWAGAALASVAVVVASIAVLSAPAGAARSPHGLTSPPTVTASTWQPTTTQDPTSSTGQEIKGVSCATSTFCVSVGWYYVGAQGYPLIQQWNGSGWTVTTPAVTPEFNFALNAVSCVSATFCEAVGFTQASNTAPNLPLAMVWNGSSWSSQTVPLPAGEAGGRLSGVSCVSATSCMAVGNSSPTTDDRHGQASSVQWNGSQWTNAVTAPNPVGPGISPDLYTFFYSVSCTSPAWCQAVGLWEFQDGTYSAGLLEQWNGNAWSQSPISNFPNGQNALASVSCAGPQFCAAVGYSYASLGDSTGPTLIEVWNGSFWSVSPSPSLGGANGDVLLGVSCFAATSCSAVGTYATDNTGNHFQNEALVWNGQSWTEVTPANNATATAQSLNAVDCVSDWACMAAGNTNAAQRSWIIVSPIARSGYRFVASDGGVFNYGAGAPFLGSLGGTHLNAPIVGIGIMPAGDGYYLVASDGGVFAYGSAQFYGSMGGKPLNKPIVGMAVTPDGGGYWLVASDGGVFAFGDAAFYGSAGGMPLNKPVVGIASAPNGLGYWIVASDGGIFNYGSAAAFLGSTGGMPLNKPVVGLGATTGGQYYLVASDGGIFAFPGGAAGPTFYGSSGAIKLNKPIVGMTPVQGGYYLSGSDGGIFAYPSGPGGLPFYGSTGGTPLNAPIVGVAS